MSTTETGFEVREGRGVTVDGAALGDDAALAQGIATLVDELDGVDAAGWYAAVEVLRPWSRHNPVITGEFARTAAVRRYLSRELATLLAAGAAITVRPSRRGLAFDDPEFFAALDEDRVDARAKKLFLFSPERMALSCDRLSHYTGTPAESFQRHVLFTNYAMHVEAFLERFPDAEVPAPGGRGGGGVQSGRGGGGVQSGRGGGGVQSGRGGGGVQRGRGGGGVQMPAYHHPLPGGDGVTLVNIGVGPANAKTATDHVAVLRPDTMIMIGHCGGLRNHQQKGDFVLATGYQRADHVLDEVLPGDVPIVPNHRLNSVLVEALDEAECPYRLGIVHTTDNRDWEFNQTRTLASMTASRSVAVDMESATIAANGFRYRIPHATLLCISDKPLHGSPKLSAGAQSFYEASKRRHLGLALTALDRVRDRFPGGLPNQEIRSVDEPLFGNG